MKTTIKYLCIVGLLLLAISSVAQNKNALRAGARIQLICINQIGTDDIIGVGIGSSVNLEYGYRISKNIEISAYIFSNNTLRSFSRDGIEKKRGEQQYSSFGVGSNVIFTPFKKASWFRIGGGLFYQATNFIEGDDTGHYETIHFPGDIEYENNIEYTEYKKEFWSNIGFSIPVRFYLLDRAKIELFLAGNVNKFLGSRFGHGTVTVNFGVKF